MRGVGGKKLVLDGSENDVAHGETIDVAALMRQRAKWMRQASSVAVLPGPKNEFFSLTLELLRRIEAGEAAILDLHPQLTSGNSPKSWRQYAYTLTPLGLTSSSRDGLELTPDGRKLLHEESPMYLASLLAERVRLFAETLALLVESPRTVEQLYTELTQHYGLAWKTPNNIRNILSWLEVLGLVESLGERRMGATEQGLVQFEIWETVSPQALTVHQQGEASEIPPPPTEISELLTHLSAKPESHADRRTYNIWVPSPADRPNKILNLKVCVAALIEPLEREQFLRFIAEEFNLKRSSVDSMLPFMRAAGLVQEIRKNLYTTTPASAAWLRTENAIDFIRLLHARMRFVGELLRVAREVTSRREIYVDAASYGLNKDKTRWLMAFLLNAGLLVETSHSSVQATPTGVKVMEELPLAPRGDDTDGKLSGSGSVPEEPVSSRESVNPMQALAGALVKASEDPLAEGEASGVAFEERLREAFESLGFKAIRISGAGDTDVLVRWGTPDGVQQKAILDAKATSSGKVSHTDVSDVAIDTHKEKHGADYVAVVGPAFRGDTIKDRAEKKGWALITAGELGQVLTEGASLGLPPNEVALVFSPENGMARFREVVHSRRRALDVLTLVITRMKEELESGEALSPRDIWMMQRHARDAPTVDELATAFELIDRLDPLILRSVESASDAKFSTYRLGDVTSAARHLRAVADALESGLYLATAPEGDIP